MYSNSRISNTPRAVESRILMSDSATPWWVVATGNWRRGRSSQLGGVCWRVVHVWLAYAALGSSPHCCLDRSSCAPLALQFLAVNIHDAGPRRVVDDALPRCNTA